VLPVFCNDKCENEYREWIKDGGDLKLMEYEKNVMKGVIK
jgi:hypothetical protein